MQMQGREPEHSDTSTHHRFAYDDQHTVVCQLTWSRNVDFVDHETFGELVQLQIIV